MRGIATIALLLTLMAPTNSAAQPAVDGYFGLAVPLTGEYAPLGKQLEQAAQFAAQETGVGLIVHDTEGTPEGASKAVKALADDPRVLAIVGPVGRRTADAAAPLANRLQVPMLVIGGSETSNRAGGWVFRLHLSPEEQARQAAKVARSLDHKKAAVFFPESEFGKAAALAFVQSFTALGGEVTAVAGYGPDETDFRKPLNVLVGKLVVLRPRERTGKYKADGKGFARSRQRPNRDFDVLFIPDNHRRVSRLLAFLPNAGIQNGESGTGAGVQLLGTSGWHGKSMELTGAKAAGALILDSFGGEAVGGRAEEFSRSFEGQFGRSPTSLEAETFDGVWMLASLLNKTSPSRRGLVGLLPRKTAWEGVAGAIRFGAVGEPIRRQELLRFDVDGVLIPMD